jgi:hypothetical protein
MPVSTHASVRGQRREDARERRAGAARQHVPPAACDPGPALFEPISGIHGFMNWPRAVLTDSGGFQSFIFARHPRHARGRRRVLELRGWQHDLPHARTQPRHAARHQRGHHDGVRPVRPGNGGSRRRAPRDEAHTPLDAAQINRAWLFAAAAVRRLQGAFYADPRMVVIVPANIMIRAQFGWAASHDGSNPNSCWYFEVLKVGSRSRNCARFRGKPRMEIPVTPSLRQFHCPSAYHRSSARISINAALTR